MQVDNFSDEHAKRSEASSPAFGKKRILKRRFFILCQLITFAYPCQIIGQTATGHAVSSIDYVLSAVEGS
jgi:hypothetical protein